ncbi:hypothetical protein JHD50_02780 [Sulfurimonas sp. MAG313]|nr:hypothetical protein [Sulfurimonas sp. MAG313]MDF1880236.1 hypothetical protein [Sulfurimonas sp. MAG313]
MKFLILLLCFLNLTYAYDESKQIHVIHPLQDNQEATLLLAQMQKNIQTYLYETPLSSYEYFNKKSSHLGSQALITWIHGDLYLKDLAASPAPSVRPTLNNMHNTHLGDYRYDIFTLLSDLLLKMQEDSDFSGSKETAILGSLVDGYFDKLSKQKLQCPSIDNALIGIKENDLLSRYTEISNKKRHFKITKPTIKRVPKNKIHALEKKMNTYFSKFNLLPVKDIVLNEYGNYLLLCEGKTTKQNDDIIFILSASTLPVSYQLNKKMKKSYQFKSVIDKPDVISSFNQTDFAGTISLNNQRLFVEKLNPSLKLQPLSEITRVYKEYAAALGFMLASYHANPQLKSCNKFTKKVKNQVNPRRVKIELISMVYAYNETLEQKWEDFSDKKFISLK